jgi:group I intron endonuclease
MVGIYKITSPSNKIYIGQSVDINRRWAEYKNMRCNTQPKLKRSFEKYGVDKHIFEIIEECSKDQLNEREIYWGKHYNVLGKEGLSLKLGEQGGIKSEESKLKQSISNTGSKHKQHKPYKTRKDIGIARGKQNNPMSDDSKQKMGKWNLGKTKSKEWSEKQSLLKKGKPNLKLKGNTNKGKIVLQCNLDGNTIKEWNNGLEASQSTGIHKGGISNCCLGKIKTSGGFIWKFK